MIIRRKTYLPIGFALLISGCGQEEIPDRGGVEPERAAQRALRADDTGGMARRRESRTPEPTAAAPTGYIDRVAKRALYEPNRLDRMDAMRELAREEKSASADDKEAVAQVFEAALMDGDPEIRTAAARMVTNYPIDVPMATRRDLAKGEPDRNVRWQLWLSIAQQWDVNEVRTHLSDALQDPDPDIRGWAEKTLERLDKTPRGLTQKARAAQQQPREGNK